MAGRYDNNPFEEEDVNPFSVRAPILHPYGADLVSLPGIGFLPRISGYSLLRSCLDLDGAQN